MSAAIARMALSMPVAAPADAVTAACLLDLGTRL